jgi:hypothetical protein
MPGTEVAAVNQRSPQHTSRLQAVPAAPHVEPETVTETTIFVPAPDLTGEPGERLMDCLGFSFKRGKRRIAVATFAEVDTGHIARKWYELPEPMVQSCKFWRDVVLAFGGNPEPNTALDLHAVFVGRRFRVRVGYRKTPGAGRSGGKARDELANQKKTGDFLRVHDLLERLA